MPSTPVERRSTIWAVAYAIPASFMAMLLWPKALIIFWTFSGTVAPHIDTIRLICEDEVIGIMPATIGVSIPIDRAWSLNL